MIVESYEDVVVLSGALHANHWETLHTAISLSLRRHPEGVVIDCSGLTSINERGADTFRNVMEFLKRHDARVIVAAVPSAIMEILRTSTDVRSQLPVVQTVEEARKSLFLLANTSTREVPKKRGAKAKEKKLLVCVVGTACDAYVIETAVQMADGLDAEVHALFPIVVPRDQPLQAPLPDQEELARATLERASEALREEEVSHEVDIERGRDVASAILSYLEENTIQFVVLGLPEDDGMDPAGKLVKTVMSKVTQSGLIFVRAPQG